MPAQGEQLVQYPFRGGLDQKTRAELLEPGSFLRLENVVAQKRGAYQKRVGNIALTNQTNDGVTIAAGARLVALGTEPVLADGHKAYGYSSRAVTWKYKDRLPEAVVDRLPIAQIGLQAERLDIAITANGYTAALYSVPDTASGSAFVYAAIVDGITAQVLTTPFLFSAYASQANFRLVAVGNRFFVFVQQLGTAVIDAYTLDTANAAAFSNLWIAHSGLISDAATSSIFDVTPGTDQIYVGYIDNSGGGASLKLKSYSADGIWTLLQSSFELCGATPTGIALGGNQSDTLWVAYNTPAGNVINVCGRNPANIVVASAATAAVITMALGGANFIGVAPHPTIAGAGILAVVGGATDRNLYYRQFSTVALNVVPTGSTAKKFRLRLESRPFSDGSRFYVMARYDTAGDATANMLFVLDLTEDAITVRPVATVAPRLSGPLSVGFAAHVAQISATKIAVLHTVKRASVSSALELVTLDFANPFRWSGSAFADAMCISGGVPSTYDGERIAEMGFLVPPDQPAITAVAAGGSTSFPGVNAWVLVYEQPDRRGNIHRSAPSVARQATIGLGFKASIVVPTLQATARQDADDSISPVRIVPYRTIAGGSIFYRCVGLETRNDPTVDTVTILDNLTDAQISVNEQLYTQPAAQLQGQVTAQPRRAAPSFSHMIAHQDRLVGIADDGTIWFTGQRVQGEGPWFADLFQFPIGIGGKPIALASQDGRIVAFKADPIIAYVEGDGPPDSGVGNDFTPPRYVATDVGCTNPRSLVTTPAGTFFQSSRGIELLNRSMQIEPFFGRAVEDLINANPVITSAVLIEPTGRIVFTCLPTEGSATGIAVVYDLVQQVWTSRTMIAGAVSACMVAGTYYWVTAAGQVYSESASSFLDVNAWVTQTVETPNLHVGGLKGFQHASKLMLYAEKLTNADIKIEVAYDNKGYLPQDVYTFTAAEIAALDRPEVECLLRQPLCQSVRARVSDATPTGGPAAGIGQGPVFIGIAISVATESGAARRSAAAGK